MAAHRDCEACDGTGYVPEVEGDSSCVAEVECLECEGDGRSRRCRGCHELRALRRGYCSSCDSALAEDAHDARREARRMEAC